MAGTAISTILTTGGNTVSASRTAVQSGFSLLCTGLMDRGRNAGIAKSDIRYATAGTAGSRIFKLEVYNAGFEVEFFDNGELKDSISFQMWLYEGSDIVELRYGSSMVSNFSKYFFPKMAVGYVKNMDTNTGNFEKFYLLNGTAAAPVLDSITSFSNKGLSTIPVSGTVYRFTPKGKASGIVQVAAGTLAKVYPTQCSNQVTIERTGTAPLSYIIISSNGQLAAQGTAGGSRTAVDLSGMTAGSYFIKLVDGNQACEIQQIIKL